MRIMTKIVSALLLAALLAGSASDAVYARCGHHGRSACATEYASCYADGVCTGDGCCDEEGICSNGGRCAGYDWRHHSGRSHRGGCHR